MRPHSLVPQLHYKKAVRRVGAHRALGSETGQQTNHMHLSERITQALLLSALTATHQNAIILSFSRNFSLHSSHFRTLRMHPSPRLAIAYTRCLRKHPSLAPRCPRYHHRRSKRAHHRTHPTSVSTHDSPCQIYPVSTFTPQSPCMVMVHTF